MYSSGGRVFDIKRETMDQLYDMMPSYTSELYPQQLLPVTSPNSGECYNLPTPPRSPLTDLTLMSNHRQQFNMEPVQTMPTDLSMHDTIDSFSGAVFENEKEIWPADLSLGLPDFFTNPFDMSSTCYPLEFDGGMMADPEDYIPSPPPSSPPFYYTYPAPGESLMTQQPINASPTRSLNSAGYDSDQDGSLGDDTCSRQIFSYSDIRRHEEYFTPANSFLSNVPNRRPAAHAQKKIHDYQVKTEQITVNELNKSNSCKKSKKKSATSLATGVHSSGKVPRKNTRGKGRREAMKGNHLWEFIRDLLKDKAMCPRIIRWENRQEGVFRFVNSEAVAGLWGSKKNNPNMNYEKLSRAMRYYYQRKILERVDGRRLVYKFGCNADGWREAAAELTEDE